MPEKLKIGNSLTSETVLPGLKVVGRVDLQEMKKKEEERIAREKALAEKKEKIAMRGRQLLANAETFHPSYNSMWDLMPDGLKKLQRQG